MTREQIVERAAGARSEADRTACARRGDPDGAPTHMTAEQILAAVRHGGERVSKATVYNTLKVLAQRGLVRQIHLDPERSVYDSTRAPHHHFHDLETGELRDIHPDDIAFSRFPTLPEGMEAEAVEVVIRMRKKQADRQRRLVRGSGIETLRYPLIRLLPLYFAPPRRSSSAGRAAHS